MTVDRIRSTIRAGVLMDDHRLLDDQRDVTVVAATLIGQLGYRSVQDVLGGLPQELVLRETRLLAACVEVALGATPPPWLGIGYHVFGTSHLVRALLAEHGGLEALRDLVEAALTDDPVGGEAISAA